MKTEKITPVHKAWLIQGEYYTKYAIAYPVYTGAKYDYQNQIPESLFYPLSGCIMPINHPDIEVIIMPGDSCITKIDGDFVKVFYLGIDSSDNIKPIIVFHNGHRYWVNDIEKLSVFTYEEAKIQKEIKAILSK